MEEFLRKLSAYIVEHPHDIHLEDADTILDVLFWAYSETSCADGQAVLQYNENLNRLLNGIRVAQMDITMPVDNWTVAQLTNLLRMLYSKQYLINRMLNFSMLYIEESFITAISEDLPKTAADFEERIQRASEADYIRGFRIADGKATLSTPFVQDEPTRWTAYADLFKGILKTAETATHISIKRLDDSENEKYHANSWLMRMGFGGADFKESRRILMGHLTGFAAFKSAADMKAHRERQAQRLREKREEAQE